MSRPRSAGEPASLQLRRTIHDFDKLIGREIRKTLEAVEWERATTPEEADCQLSIYWAGVNRVA